MIMKTTTILSVFSFCCINFIFFNGALSLIFFSVYYGTDNDKLYPIALYFWALTIISSVAGVCCIIPPLIFTWFSSPSED